MFRRVISAAMIAVVVVSAAGSAVAQRRQVMLDKVVAVVGGSSILYSDVEAYADELVQQGDGIYLRPRPDERGVGGVVAAEAAL